MRNAECVFYHPYFSLSMTFGSREAMLINCLWVNSPCLFLWSKWKTCAYIVWARNACVCCVKKVDAYPRKWHKSLKMDPWGSGGAKCTHTHIYIAINTLPPMQICFNFSSFMSFVCSIYFPFFLNLLPNASERKLPLSMHLRQFNRIQVEVSACGISGSGFGWFAMQWRRCPYDSLFDFVRFGFVVFRSCNFHICIFPRPQTAHSANICQQLRGCVSRAPICACLCAHMNMNAWYPMFSDPNWNAQTNERNAKRDSVHKIVECVAYQMNEAKKRHIMIFLVSFCCVCGFCFLVLKLNSHVKEKKPRVGEKNNKWSRKSDSFW